MDLLVVFTASVWTLTVFVAGMWVRGRLDTYKQPLPGIKELVESVTPAPVEEEPAPPKIFRHLGDPNDLYEPSRG
jgi:hypothetical protein